MLEVREKSEFIDILFVDDNSSDDSNFILTSFVQTRRQCNLIKNSGKEHGYGAAVMAGIHFARNKNFDWAIVCDTDLSNPLQEVYKLSKTCMELKANSQVIVIKANRFWGKKIHMSGVNKNRWIFSLSGNLVSRVLTGNVHPDPTNGFRAVNLKRYPIFDSRSGFVSILQEIYECQILQSTVEVFNTELRTDLAVRKHSSFDFTLRILVQYTFWSVKIGIVRLINLFK
jgi:glycosyltransferase involved in cell wall biosynthesis